MTGILIAIIIVLVLILSFVGFKYWLCTSDMEKIRQISMAFNRRSTNDLRSTNGQRPYAAPAPTSSANTATGAAANAKVKAAADAAADDAAADDAAADDATKVPVVASDDAKEGFCPKLLQRSGFCDAGERETMHHGATMLPHMSKREGYAQPQPGYGTVWAKSMRSSGLPPALEGYAQPQPGYGTVWAKSMRSSGLPPALEGYAQPQPGYGTVWAKSMKSSGLPPALEGYASGETWKDKIGSWMRYPTGGN
tara:strand:+ start:40331 stop:41086 length:756 start_codon:yes stop_codon:yes gene_type:complete